MSSGSCFIGAKKRMRMSSGVSFAKPAWKAASSSALTGRTIAGPTPGRSTVSSSPSG